MPTLVDMREEVRSLLSQPAGSEINSMIDTQVNRVYRHLLNEANIDEQKRKFTFTTVSGTYLYGMPLYVKETLSIIDPTNNRALWDVSQKEFDLDYPGNTDSGTPTKAIPYGHFGVQTQPAATGVVSVQSDSILDAGSNFTIQITGFSGGNLVTENVQLNGTSATNSTNSYTADTADLKVVKVLGGTATTTNGNITVKDSSSNTLAVVPVWVDSPTYEWWELHPRPDAAITYDVRSLMRKPDLVNDSDFPDFDPDYHDLLVYGTVGVIGMHMGKEGVATVHRNIFRERRENFKDAQGSYPSRVRTFSNIQTQAQFGDRPRRPYFPGDYL